MPIHHTATGALVSGAATIGASSNSLQLLDRATKLLSGASALADLGEKELQASIFLASWCLELALKGYLDAKGQGKKELASIRHNLSKLWECAAKEGLCIAAAPPRWCELLSATHDHPYHQRYPTEAIASVAPQIQVVVKELEALVATVKKALP